MKQSSELVREHPKDVDGLIEEWLEAFEQEHV